ncbi:MAG TPA: hypothetical protein VMZ32_13310 [Gammaproteobacteria bacterium]|nr:hypothetical protein [Gammaproteobacteria bacterium]
MDHLDEFLGDKIVCTLDAFGAHFDGFAELFTVTAIEHGNYFRARPGMDIPGQIFQFRWREVVLADQDNIYFIGI